MRVLFLATPLFVAAAISAPVAHASPVDDYVGHNGQAVCAALDRAQSNGDIFRLTLTIAHSGGFNVKEAANVIGRSAAADCPWESSKMRQTGGPATAPAALPDQ